MKIVESVLVFLKVIRFEHVYLKPDELLADRKDLRASYWRRLVIYLSDPVNVRKPVVLTNYVELRRAW